jgi:predicted Zn-dependent protease
MALVVLAAVVAAGILGQQLRAVERDAQAARAGVAAGKPAAARAPLLRWLRARPSSAEAHALLAEVALAQGDLGEVARELNRARELGCSQAQWERVHALTLARLGRYLEAEPILTRLWNEQAQSDPAVDEALARIYLRTYRLNKARAVLERWIHDAPSDGRPFLWLTEIDRRTEVDNPHAWEEHYREALRRDPELDPARLGLAETLRQVHRNGEADEEFRRYLARHPDDPAALIGGGRNALELGDAARAGALLDRARTVAPADPSVLRAAAELELRRNLPETARQYLDQALRADPFDAEALYLRAQVRARLDDPDGAQADRAAFDRLKRDQAELLRLRERVLDHPGDADTRAKVAAWMFAHGRPQDGLEWAMAVLARDPNHVPTCRLLADYYRKQPDGTGLANFYQLKADAQATAPKPKPKP